MIESLHDMHKLASCEYCGCKRMLPPEPVPSNENEERWMCDSCGKYRSRRLDTKIYTAWERQARDQESAKTLSVVND